jgi:hypothetical protein
MRNPTELAAVTRAGMAQEVAALQGQRASERPGPAALLASLVRTHRSCCYPIP